MDKTHPNPTGKSKNIKTHVVLSVQINIKQKELLNWLKWWLTGETEMKPLTIH